METLTKKEWQLLDLLMAIGLENKPPQSIDGLEVLGSLAKKLKQLHPDTK